MILKVIKMILKTILKDDVGNQLVSPNKITEILEMTIFYNMSLHRENIILTEIKRTK